MSSRRDQLIALGGLFNVAVMVDGLARTGLVQEDQLACMLGSLPIRQYAEVVRHFSRHRQHLRPGYGALKGALQRDFAQTGPDVLRYALLLVTLESRLSKRQELLRLIGDRLKLIDRQAQHFGITHSNVIDACAATYQDSLSTFRLRIQVKGEGRFLQQPQNAARIRALLLTGILAVRLWKQSGGRRWQLIFSRGRLLNDLDTLLY